jgi:hypothetical protein
VPLRPDYLEVEVDPQAVTICHCTDCQILTGSAFRADVPAPATHFVLRSCTPKSSVKAADSGNQRRDAFCGDVGHRSMPVRRIWKRNRFKAADVNIPSNLTFVPIDFERASLLGVLRATDFAFGARTLYSWMGVTQYLTGDASIPGSASFFRSRPRAESSSVFISRKKRCVD